MKKNTNQFTLAIPREHKSMIIYCIVLLFIIGVSMQRLAEYKNIYINDIIFYSITAIETIWVSIWIYFSWIKKDIEIMKILYYTQLGIISFTLGTAVGLYLNQLYPYYHPPI